MTYVLDAIVTVAHNRLSESYQFDQPLSRLAEQESYLVVQKGQESFSLSLSNILLFQKGLDRTQSVAQAILPLVTDLFVQRYHAPFIPLKNYNGFYNKRVDVYNPMAYKNWQVSFTSVDTPHILDDVTRKGFLDDIAIRSDRNLSRALVSVNGVFHRTRFLDNVLYVLDGFRTMRLTDRKDVAVVDMGELGGVTTIPLTPARVKEAGWQQPVAVNAGQSLRNKTVFLVVDGYFYHMNHRVFTLVDDQNFVIHTHKLPLIQQFRRNPRTLYQVDRLGDASQSSRKYEDAFENIFLDKRQVPASALETAAFQHSRLTHYHSFLVVVDNPHVFTVERDLQPTGTPRYYYDPSSQGISGMMAHGCGLSPSYLLWRDAHGRKSVFLPEYDQDNDWQNHHANPFFIPTLTPDAAVSAKQWLAKLIDYVSA